MKGLLYVFAALVAAYGVTVLAAFLLQDRLLFFPRAVSPQARARLQPHAVRFDHAGTALEGWLVRRDRDPSAPFLIYHGGNGEEVSASVVDLVALPLSGFLLLNYSGYGDCGGRPAAADLCADALFVLDALTEREGIDPRRVVVMGRSLGTGVAAHVAARRPVAGLLLVTPFDRLSDVAAHHYPLLPVRILLRHELDAIGQAPAITAPSLVILAEHDRTVPPRFGRRLFAALPEPKTMVIVAGADHDDVGGHAAYREALTAFLDSLADLR
jgi:pimeloyl-ACP methyl ester carboxylesterase